MLGQSLQTEVEHTRYFQYTFTSVTVFVHNSELLRLLTFCLFSTQNGVPVSTGSYSLLFLKA